jgi:ribose transport system substrate-binding protein
MARIRSRVAFSTPSSGPARRLGRLAALALAGALTLACGSSGRQAVQEINAGETAAQAPATPSSTPRVALIMKTLTNPFFVDMEKGARKAQQEGRIELRVRTATQETSIEQQIQLVANEIRDQVQAIVIAPGDSMRLVPILKKAQDAGIQIVNIDNRLDAATMAGQGMKPVPFISVDNEKGAYQATRFVVDRIHAPTEVALVEGIRSANNAELRKRGAERGFRSNPQLRIVAQESANWKIDEAYGVTRALFKAHPGIGVLFCANDMMAIGAVKFLQETGRSQVRVIGFDALDEARKAVRAGQMAVTVDQQPDQQGYLGVQTALRMLHGERVPMELVVETRLVTPASLK